MDEDMPCDMRGMLSFMILWLLSKRSMYGQEIAAEIEKRRGERPSPGTIYPALKDLASHGMIKSHLEGRNDVYELTEQGEAGLEKALKYFRKVFGDILDAPSGPPEGRLERTVAGRPRTIKEAGRQRA